MINQKELAEHDPPLALMSSTTSDPNCPKGFVYKLRKAVYGLRQSPRELWKLLRDTILGMNWTQSIIDQCLFYRGSGESLELCR